MVADSDIVVELGIADGAPEVALGALVSVLLGVRLKPLATDRALKVGASGSRVGHGSQGGRHVDEC